MKFLVDENLPTRFADQLRTAGHAASHVSDHGLSGADDAAVLEQAIRDQAVLVTYDGDFAAMLVLEARRFPSLVLFRDQQRRPEELAALLVENLAAIEHALREGAIAVFDRSRVRVRELPVDTDRE